MQSIPWLRGTRPADVIAAVHSIRPGDWLYLSLSNKPGETLVVLDPRLTVLGRDALAGPLREALARPRLLTLLIPPGPLPPVTGKSYGPVHSFVGPAALLDALSIGPAELTPETLCYWALRSVMRGAAVGVVARECSPKQDHLPPWTPGTTPSPPGRTALVMAHRGPAEFLAAALKGLTACDPAPEVIRVGLDVGDEELGDYRQLVEASPGVEFYAGSHAPVGPYMIRQALGSEAAERFLVFHDSDDHSTADRFHWLHAEMQRGGPGLVGSHELRYDEDDREVRAVRFPLDVTAALTVAPKHPQLHPTTMVPADDFRRAGGFSTDCVFGNDTQFLLRAFFQMPMRNVDRFLYIRRDHWGSLTNAPETGMSNPVRTARNLAWWADFEAVKAGRLALANSSLRTANGCAGWQLRRLYAPRPSEGALP
jgi:hypothetical protein